MALLTVHTHFATAPQNAVGIMLTNKYGKPVTVFQQFDDNQFKGFRNLTKIWEDNNHGFTDGCGNRVPCSAEVGLVIDGADISNLEELKFIISKRGALANHSAFHNRPDPQNPNDPNSALIQIGTIDQKVIDLLGYYMTTFIVPGDFVGFAELLRTMFNYRGMDSEGDYFQPYNSERHHEIIPDYPILDFDSLIRNIRDDIDNVNTMNLFKGEIDALKSGRRNFYMMASHSDIESQAQKAGYKEVYDYLFQVMGDDVLMCTLREFLDYRTMRTAIVSQSLTGNVLTYTVDTDNLNPRTSFFDISLHIQADAQITDVTVEGFDNASFNPSTGLVNAFKSPYSSTVVVPEPEPQIIMVKYGKFIVS